MDVLSALKMMNIGSSQTSSTVNEITQSGIIPNIPPAELQRLNSDLGPSSVGAAAETGGSGTGFQNVLSDFAGQVNAQQNAANDAAAGLMSGKNVSLHQVMISMEEASVSFQMMVEVRNKLLDSYQELMRMQV